MKSKNKEMNKIFLPISIDIADRKILIIGGGQSAVKKIKILKRFNAQIEVLAINVCEEIKQSRIKYHESEYREEFLEGFLMLHSCTNKLELNKKNLADGKERGVLVNIHDQPELCQFVSSAIYKRKNITVAVGSNGEDVYESIRIRNSIWQFLTTEYYKN